MSFINFPNVPNVPGVPPLLRSATQQAVNSVLARAPFAQELGLQFNVIQSWGIFSDTGSPVLTGSSVVGFEYRKEYAISDYPTTNGGFQSYNKVERPFDAVVSFVQSGTEDEVAAFLAKAEAVAGSLDLYTVTTPEITYPNANVVSVRYRRTAESGAKMPTVDVAVRQVRITAQQAFVDPNAPPDTPVDELTVTAASPKNPTAGLIRNLGPILTRQLPSVAVSPANALLRQLGR